MYIEVISRSNIIDLDSLYVICFRYNNYKNSFDDVLYTSPIKEMLINFEIDAPLLLENNTTSCLQSYSIPEKNVYLQDKIYSCVLYIVNVFKIVRFKYNIKSNKFYK